MNDLYNTTKLVRTILESDERSRNSDSFLYLKVLEHKATSTGIDLEGLTVPFFLQSMDILGFPGFETVRRTRQKIQQHHPELAACEKVEGFRMENEKKFRAYARGNGQDEEVQLW